MSIYGDSFTYGVDVKNEAAWSNQLSILLGCRVANYGVGGYGSDQAALRFELNRDDEAPVVILSHLSENILRNLNRYRALISPDNAWGWKPRFVLQPDDSLRLVPMPRFTDADDYDRAMRNPAERLADEYFLPGGPSGVGRPAFPYGISLLRALFHFHIRAKLRGEPAYAEFYAADHPARGVELTARILERFARTARERGKLPVLQIIPTGLDLMAYRETGRWVYASLVQRANALGIDVVDQGPRLMEILRDRDPCSIYLGCNSHMNGEGHELLARQVAVALDEREIRETAARMGRWPYPIAHIDPRPAPAVASGPPDSSRQ